MPIGLKISVAILFWSAVTLWAVKKYWRNSDDPKEAVFWAEVKLLGLAITIGSALTLPTSGALPWTSSYWPQVAFWAFLLFPGALWSAYVGTRLIHYLFD